MAAYLSYPTLFGKQFGPANFHYFVTKDFLHPAREIRPRDNLCGSSGEFGTRSFAIWTGLLAHSLF